MKKRPGIAIAFAVSLCVGVLVVLAFGAIGGAVAASSDGAYAPHRAEGSGAVQNALGACYFLCGVAASFCTTRVARVACAVVAHLSVCVIWIIQMLESHSKADVEVMVLLSMIFLLIPSVLWFCLLIERDASGSVRMAEASSS